jgi:hypothetical protein
MQKPFYVGVWIRSRGNNLEPGTQSTLPTVGPLQPLSTTLINLMSNHTAKMYHSELREAWVAWLSPKLVWQPELDFNANFQNARRALTIQASHEEM